jgi:hypothetical protein
VAVNIEQNICYFIRSTEDKDRPKGSHLHKGIQTMYQKAESHNVGGVQHNFVTTVTHSDTRHPGAMDFMVEVKPGVFGILTVSFGIDSDLPENVRDAIHKEIHANLVQQIRDSDLVTEFPKIAS